MAGNRRNHEAPQIGLHTLKGRFYFPTGRAVNQGDVLKKGKPFFFRIESAALLDFATDPEGENMTLRRFAKELQKGKSEVVFIQGIIDEAHVYIEKKRAAGASGGLAKASSAKAVP